MNKPYLLFTTTVQGVQGPVCFLTQFPQPPGNVEEKWTKVHEKIFLPVVMDKL